MRLLLNGTLYLNGDEVFCEDLLVETDAEELEFEFEEVQDGRSQLEEALMREFDNLYIEDFCEDYISEDGIEAMIDDYAEAIFESDLCFECVRDILSAMVDELIEEVEEDDFYY